MAACGYLLTFPSRFAKIVPVDPAEYRKLVERFPPVPIHNDEQLAETETAIGELLALHHRTPAQDAFLELLSMLVSEWEDANVQIPRLTGRELLEVLLEERGMRQKDLVPVFGTESIVSEVLSGKRQMNLRHINRLAAFFHVSPSAFMHEVVPDAELVPA